MSLLFFGVCLVAGAAAIAAWITVRFPQISARRVRAILIHAAVVTLLAQLLRFGITPPVSDSPAVQLIAGIFTVVLPVLVYTFLIAIWLLRIVQDAINGMLR
jgi:hypothetical protein